MLPRTARTPPGVLVARVRGTRPGKTFELADVAAGGHAGTFYGTSAAGCPADDGSGANLKAFGGSRSQDPW